MFVALMNAEMDLRIPIVNFLLETRAVIDRIREPFDLDRATGVLRGGWEHLQEDFLWAACVYAISARTIASGMETPDQHEFEGWALCDCFRERHPKAPAGFEKIGRTAAAREE